MGRRHWLLLAVAVLSALGCDSQNFERIDAEQSQHSTFQEVNERLEASKLHAYVAPEFQSPGIYFLECYSERKIPVLFVHGIRSDTDTWKKMLTELRSKPEIRERYQFWLYAYDWRQPFWETAAKLRRDWERLRSELRIGVADPNFNEAVVVGHSMGGLIARLQAVESGHDYWSVVSSKKVTDRAEARRCLCGPPRLKEQLLDVLFFLPNPSVARIITIGTPCRGSDYSNNTTRRVFRHSFPGGSFRLLKSCNPTLLDRNCDLLTSWNAIDCLCPDSPIFPVMLKSRYSDRVRINNIVGAIEEVPMFARLGLGPMKSDGIMTDGIVRIDSAQMDDAESEIMAEMEHSQLHCDTRTIAEVYRILVHHLNAIRRNNLGKTLSQLEVQRGVSKK